MARKSVKSGVKSVREAVDSLGKPAEFRKLQAVVNALELLVDDGQYQRPAVTRLCEALLATAQLYDVPEELVGKLEEAACAVVALVEDSRYQLVSRTWRGARTGKMRTRVTGLPFGPRRDPDYQQSERFESNGRQFPTEAKRELRLVLDPVYL